MKINANFGRPPLPWHWAAALLWSVTVLALLFVAFSVSSMRQLAADEPALRARLHRAQAQLSRQLEVELPSARDQDALRGRIREWNELAGVTGWGTAQLLAWLEAHTPADVYFVSFQHEPREGQALLVAQSSSKTVLTTFLRTLEQQPAFVEVLLSKQSERAAPSQSAQFEIRLRLRS